MAMKAMAQRSWRTGEPLDLIDLPTPEPREGEVRIRVRSIGLNPADCQLLLAPSLRAMGRIAGLAPPVVLGLDFAGIVDKVGGSVGGFQPGDRVVGGASLARFIRGPRRWRGCFADTVIANPSQICLVPDAVDLDTAVGLAIPGVTARRAIIEIGHIRQVPPADRRILVLGASGAVGQLAVQIGKLEGAFVAGVCSTKNLDLVTGLGADVALDYTTGDVLDQAREHGPYQVIIDCADAYSRRRCLSMLSRRGRFVMVAMHNPVDAVVVTLPPFRARTILGTPTATRLAPLLAAAEAGQLTVNIAERLPLTSLQEAVELSESHRMTGKLILYPE